MEMMLYAIRQSLNENPAQRLPRLHVVIADASAFSNAFSQDYKPNGFAAGPDGSIYVSNFSVFPGVNADPVGQVVRVDN
jgi:hypothetical protein